MFKDRKDAGEQLAKKLTEDGISADLVVAASPNDLPVARAVAEELGVQHDILSVSTIKAPFNRDVALGAITDAGSTWLNRERIDELGIDNVYTEGGLRVEQENAVKQRDEHYGRSSPDLESLTVLLVSEGVTDGAIERAAINHAREHRASSVALAAPFIASEQVEELENQVDRLVTLETPTDLWSVATQYETYEELTPGNASNYLPQHRPDA